jgi:hypothetical protein
LGHTSSTNLLLLPYQRDQHLQRLLQICEDLDTEGRGYVNTAALAQILRRVPGVRPEVISGAPTHSGSPRMYKMAYGYGSNEHIGSE